MNDPKLLPRGGALPLALLLLLLAGTTLLAAVLFWPATPPTQAAATGAPRSDGTAVPTSAPTLAPVGEPAAEPAVAREAAVPPADAPQLPDFTTCIEELVDIAERTSAFVAEDEVAAATASDRLAQERFATLLERFPDAGERALHLLAGLATGSDERRDVGRRHVLRLVLGAVCTRRHTAAGGDDADRSLADLVQTMLDVLPQDEPLAATLMPLLADQPWLDARHEPSVLGLQRLASEGGFSAERAARLLLTLWRNLRARGGRSADDLTRQALLQLADPDLSQRLAAARQLLESPAHHALVFAWLRERKDQEVAEALGGLAANELPPPLALRTLRELAPLVPRQTHAFLALGFRAPDLLADTYRELLASDTHPTLRAELVTGAGMGSNQADGDLATLALHSDPSPDVRLQAGFVITARGDAEAGERACDVLLDLPKVAQDPLRLGAVVMMLQNLEAAGHINAVDRLGARLRTLALSDSSRLQLDSILARAIPAGRAMPDLPGQRR
jgi:hypothetical protein